MSGIEVLRSARVAVLICAFVLVVWSDWRAVSVVLWVAVIIGVLIEKRLLKP